MSVECWSDPGFVAPSKAAVEEIPDLVPGEVVWEERGMWQMVDVNDVNSERHAVEEIEVRIYCRQ